MSKSKSARQCIKRNSEAVDGSRATMTPRDLGNIWVMIEPVEGRYPLADHIHGWFRFFRKNDRLATLLMFGKDMPPRTEPTHKTIRYGETAEQ